MSIGVLALTIALCLCIVVTSVMVNDSDVWSNRK